MTKITDIPNSAAGLSESIDDSYCANDSSPLIEKIIDRSGAVTPVDKAYLKDILTRVYNYGIDRHYVDWLTQYISLPGKSVLDIGCLNCWYAPFLLGRGVKSYTGIDLYFNPDTCEIQNLDKRHNNLEMPLTLSEFLGYFPDIQTVTGDICETQFPENSFDCAIMLQTTEHLDQPRSVYNTIYRLLEDNGILFFSHHNFYCWNGHHFPPARVCDYDDSELSMSQLADWNHIRNRKLLDGSGASLNFIRIHELMEIAGKYFNITKLEKRYSTEETGYKRLTTEIRNSLPEYYEDELLVETLRVVCIKSSSKAVYLDKNNPLDLPEVIPLSLNNSTAQEGKCYLVGIPFGVTKTNYALFEDEQMLGPGDVVHEDIKMSGGGTYSIWGKYIYMSTSDNSNPTTNGRVYTVRRI